MLGFSPPEPSAQSNERNERQKVCQKPQGKQRFGQSLRRLSDVVYKEKDWQREGGTGAEGGTRTPKGARGWLGEYGGNSWFHNFRLDAR